MSRKKLNYSEEDFLFNSFKEIVNIWTRGFGSANFLLEINNGKAELTMKVSLRPRPPMDTQVVTSKEPFAAGNTSNKLQPRRKKKYKSPSQRNRDQRRAANFRLQKNSLSRVVLPITGKLLPLNGSADVSDTVKLDNEVLDTPPSALITSPPKMPLKCSKTRNEFLSGDGGNLLSAKKQLFVQDTVQFPNDDLVTNSSSTDVPAYQKKEKALWDTLFN